MTEPRHEPATCDQPSGVCECCDGYNIGYSAGKDKARQEIMWRLDDVHLVGCACAPCDIVRAVLQTSFDARPSLWEYPVVEERNYESGKPQ